MKRIIFSILLLSSVFSQDMWINEIHYDNYGNLIKTLKNIVRLQKKIISHMLLIQAVVSYGEQNQWI